MTQEPEITTIGEKGQVVIPQRLRKHLGVTPRTKFIVFGKGDTIVLRRLRLPDVRKEWDEVFEELDHKDVRLTARQVTAEVQARRRSKSRARVR